jgi:acyl-CoA thioester hydrolase
VVEFVRMHRTELRVRYVECDMQGHVFNAHYLTWCDMAHTEAIRATLGDIPSLVARGIDFVVAEATVRFRSAARFDDLLVVEVAFRPPGTTSLVSDFAIRRGDDLLVEAELRHVCVDTRTYTKTPWPDWALAGLAGGA